LGDEADVVFDFLDDVVFLVDVEDAGDEFFELVGESFAADFETADGGVEGPAAVDGCDCGVGVAGVYYQEAF
jgi:hypothetical protein